MWQQVRRSNGAAPKYRYTSLDAVARLLRADFLSDALNLVKAGHKITRSGWNGRGMYVVYQAGYPKGIAINGNTATATGIAEGTICFFRPYLMMCTVDGDFVPWVASQTDLLADDWETA